jgi:hypothetical protein
MVHHKDDIKLLFSPQHTFLFTEDSLLGVLHVCYFIDTAEYCLLKKAWQTVGMHMQIGVA